MDRDADAGSILATRCALSSSVPAPAAHPSAPSGRLEQVMQARYLAYHDGDDCTVYRMPDSLTATDDELDARLEAVLDRIMDDIDGA